MGRGGDKVQADVACSSARQINQGAGPGRLAFSTRMTSRRLCYPSTTPSSAARTRHLFFSSVKGKGGQASPSRHIPRVFPHLDFSLPILVAFSNFLPFPTYEAGDCSVGLLRLVVRNAEPASLLPSHYMALTVALSCGAKKAVKYWAQRVYFLGALRASVCTVAYYHFASILVGTLTLHSPCPYRLARG